MDINMTNHSGVFRSEKFGLFDIFVQRCKAELGIEIEITSCTNTVFFYWFWGYEKDGVLVGMLQQKILSE